MCACVRACVRACVCVCDGAGWVRGVEGGGRDVFMGGWEAGMGVVGE